MSEEKKQSSDQNYGPGNVLRAKREEYEWSVEAVAEALHLSTHSVKAIEADRYEDLPGSTYVIGYWRSYARLLGIDIEETIEVNKRNLQVVTAEPSGMDINRLMQHKRRSSGFGWLILLVILGGAIYFAWQQQFFGLFDEINIGNSEEMPQIQDSAKAPDSPEVSAKKKQAQVLRPLVDEKDENSKAVGQTVSPAGKNKSSAQSEDMQVSPEKKQVFSSVTSPGAQSLDSGQSGLKLTPVVAETNSASNENEGKNLLQAQTGTNSTTAVATADETQNSSSVLPVSKTDQVVAGSAASGGSVTNMTLTLSKDSWLDIRDKTNKRLLYKTEAAGQTIEVKGTPPFYVYIGTPDGVSIRYQGKDVPFETHKSGLFARFKLGAETLEAL